MALIAVAAIPTVASFIARMGVTRAAKKYAPKLIKEAQKYVKKHNLTKKAPTLGKKTAESMKKTTKKMQVVKKKVNPKTKVANKKTTTQKKTTTKKDSFDEQLKKKEGAAKFNKTNKDATKKQNRADPAYVDKFGNAHRTQAGADRASKLKKNPFPQGSRTKKTTTKKTTTKKENKAQISDDAAKQQKKISTMKTGLFAGAAATTALPFLTKGPSNKKSKASGPSSFGQAFREARKEKGTDSVFTYKGKQYSTVTMDEVKKAGFNTLREYLNAKKKKSGTTKPGT